MPRNVRNFWCTISTQDREVATGPKRKEEGIDVTIQMRNDGSVDSGVSIRGYVDGDDLVLTVDGVEVKRTKR